MKITLAAAAITAILIATPAATQQLQRVCGERAKILAHLNKNYGEVPYIVGLAANGSVLEITRNTAGSWTLLYTHTDGTSCVVGSGESLQTISAEPNGIAL